MYARVFGTNMDILQNKFNEETWNAYYEGKIKTFAIQLSLVMSNMTFSDREIACGNAITFSANRLQYASNATKLQVSTQLFDRALLNRNGVMDIWNMPHVEDGEKYISERNMPKWQQQQQRAADYRTASTAGGAAGDRQRKGKRTDRGRARKSRQTTGNKKDVNNAD